MHYNELERLTKTIKKLTKHCEIFTNLQEQIYKIYFNN